MEIPLLVLADESLDPLIWGMPQWAAWIVIVCLLIFTGLFSASENAFSQCNKYHYRAEADKGKGYAKIITKLVDDFDHTLVTILVTSNTLSTLMSYLSAMIWYNICVANGWGDAVEVILSTVVMGFLFYVVADTIPKVISKAIPNQIAVLMAYPLRFLQIILFPVFALFNGLLKLVHKALHLKDENLLSKEEILFQADKAINEESILVEDEEDPEEPEKLFEKDETVILDNVWMFDTRTVSDVFTPLEKTFALDINGLTADKVNEVIRKSEYSRIPIYDEKKDNIIGVLVVRSYFETYMEDPHLSIPSILEPVVSLSLDITLDDALDELNSEKVHLAVVKKDDVVLGIITMEDILEEVVEDISEDPTIDPDMEAYNE